MRRGYARVSTRDQSLARQVDALEAAGCDEVWRESASGADFERPVWRELDAALAEGDELVVLSVDRLGRSYDEVLSVWRSMAGRGVRVRALDMPLLDRGGDVTARLVSDVALELLSYVAQVERENTRERQRQGIEAAMRRGVSFGRPRKEPPERWPALRDAILGGRVSLRAAARACHVSPATVSRWLSAGD